jgi:hypothetical protein
MCKVMPQEEGITEIGTSELRRLRSSYFSNACTLWALPNIKHSQIFLLKKT